jgi:hypothetical protein
MRIFRSHFFGSEVLYAPSKNFKVDTECQCALWWGSRSDSGDLLFTPEDERSMFLRNIDEILLIYTALCPRKDKKPKVKLSMCLINWAPCHEDLLGSGVIVPPFYTSAVHGGQWSASCTCRFSVGKEPRYTLERRLGGPHSRSECCGVKKNLLLVKGIEHLPSSP